MTILIILLVLWDLYWKAHALWMAAQNNDKKFFIALLVVNSVGILPIYYLYKEWIFKIIVDSNSLMKMLKNNIKYSIIEGSFFAFMFGLGENYLSALGVFLGYSALQISILSSLPQLAGAFIQLASNSMAKLFQSMKRLVVFLSVLQSLLWIALIFIIFNTNNYELILLWSVIYYGTACAMGPVWISWIGYLVKYTLKLSR